MADHAPTGPQLRVSELSPRKVHRFDMAPDEAGLHALAERLGLRGLRKVRFEGQLAAEGREDWRLDAKLGATVTQDCVVTLEPVTTRLEEEVSRRFLADWPPAAEQGDEVEMPEDESIDPLGDVIDLKTVLEEALSLALPPYPRKDDAAPVEAQAIPPGAAPIDESETKPFAGLAELKKKLEDKE